MVDPTFRKLESHRLILRRFTDSDVEPFLAYRSDPDVERYQGWGDYTREDAQRFVEGMRSLHPDIPGQGFQFAIELKDASELIGDCFLLTLLEEPRQAEIGFTLASERQGRGYATEAVLCLLDYVFTNLQKHRVTARTDCENTRSVALLDRVGMRREGHFLENIWFKGNWGDEYLYAVLRSEWIAKDRERRKLAQRWL